MIKIPSFQTLDIRILDICLGADAWDFHFLGRLEISHGYDERH